MPRRCRWRCHATSPADGHVLPLPRRSSRRAALRRVPRESRRGGHATRESSRTRRQLDSRARCTCGIVGRSLRDVPQQAIVLRELSRSDRAGVGRRDALRRSAAHERASRRLRIAACARSAIGSGRVLHLPRTGSVRVVSRREGNRRGGSRNTARSGLGRTDDIREPSRSRSSPRSRVVRELSRRCRREVVRELSRSRWRRRESASAGVVEPATAQRNALPDVSSDRSDALMFVRVVVLALVVAACGNGRAERPADHVPAVWRTVRDSAGHRAHVEDANVPCRDCHGESGFTAPPADLCGRCHGEVATPLHPTDPIGIAATPACQDCHGFGTDLAVRPTSCMRCHEQAQGLHVAAVGAHADQPCGDCHRAHRTPSLETPACTSCHAQHDTRHAGARGCLDCHSMHEPELAADAGCALCHSQQRGKVRVDAKAITAGHPTCTGCHTPHAFGKQDAATCTSCHTKKPVLAAAKHDRCAYCHAPHDTTKPKACASCHDERAAHPPSTKHGDSCVGCHPPHTLAAGEKALSCESCHEKPHHATTRCLDCHAPHAAKPALNAALCSTCHSKQTASAATTGHAACTSCHANAAHEPALAVPVCASCHSKETKLVNRGHADCASCHKTAAHQPQSPPPSCSTCHTAQASSAPRGHQACESCHDPHKGTRRPSATCASCHTKEASRGHGPDVACASCHRAHGPNGVATSPSCASCHPAAKRPALHAVKGHHACDACHSSHELAPRDDRATCLSCHRDQTKHEPSATRCAGCHPFGD